MAMNDRTRWTLFREVIGSRKSGALVLQLGPKYLTWAVRAGNLMWISSTDPEHTFTHFLLKHSLIEKSLITRAQSLVSDRRSLGAALMRGGAADPDTLHDWISRHAAAHSHFLLQTTAHVFWTDHVPSCKPEFVTHAGVPLWQILLTCDRTAVEIRSAVQFGEEMPKHYRIEGWESLVDTLLASERRVLPYLRRGEGLDRILADPELDRLTCYRTLFLVWLSGFMKAVQPQAAVPPASSAPIWNRIRSVPPDWIIPLTLGIGLGLFLSPSPPKPVAPQPRVERLNQILQQPAWRDTVDLEKADGGAE